MADVIAVTLGFAVGHLLSIAAFGIYPTQGIVVIAQASVVLALIGNRLVRRWTGSAPDA